jgi:hypothetical protein
VEEGQGRDARAAIQCIPRRRTCEGLCAICGSRFRSLAGPAPSSGETLFRVSSASTHTLLHYLHFTTPDIINALSSRVFISRGASITLHDMSFLHIQPDLYFAPRESDTRCACGTKGFRRRGAATHNEGFDRWSDADTFETTRLLSGMGLRSNITSAKEYFKQDL